MPDEDPDITELDNLTKLITSREWIEALKITKVHKDYLQKEVNRFVREQNMIQAYGALARYDDADKIFKMVKDRLDILKNKPK